MKRFFTLITLVSLATISCTKDPIDVAEPIFATMELASDSGFDSMYSGDTLVITYNGAKYFPMQLNLSYLPEEEYVNGVPIVTADWDTNYWYTLQDGIYMWSSLYNLLDSSFNQNFTYAIASETYQVQIPDVAELDEVMNADGSFMRNGEFHDNAYTQFNTDLRTRQMFALNENMVGVPITITAEVSVGEDGDNTIFMERIVMFK